MNDRTFNLYSFVAMFALSQFLCGVVSAGFYLYSMVRGWW